MTGDYQQRFGGIARLYGNEGLERLAQAHVCVVGVGGVGSWTVEALVRSGVGQVTLIDMDDVCITNTNRQLPALVDTVGQTKVSVLAERMNRINPECRVHPITEFLTAATVERHLAGPFHYVIDAVDRASTKALIISRCLALQLPVLTVGGAGGRRDATAVRCGDLARTGGDDLLRGVRRRLRREYAMEIVEGVTLGVSAVYSAEPQVFPWADGTCRTAAEAGGSLKMDCASGFGAATFVTGAFGFAAAGEAIRFLTTPR